MQDGKKTEWTSNNARNIAYTTDVRYNGKRITKEEYEAKKSKEETREVPLSLLKEMIYYLTTTNGLYATDREDIIKEINEELWFRLNETMLRKKIEEYI